MPSTRPIRVLLASGIAAAFVAAAGSPVVRGAAPQAPVQVVIDEWDTPTPDTHPHDPLWADGYAWYTGQRANLLGRLDPRTGTVREFKLPGDNPPQGHGPHGLINDKDGNIWYTANFFALIGKLNPATGEVTEYKMPDPRARDPHTPIFDQQGTLWFTVQGGQFVGTLDPKTGAIQLKEVVAPAGGGGQRANPYGLVIDSAGVPYFDMFATNAIGRIDPATLAIKAYLLPDKAARPRRIALAADDTIYYTDYGRGYLGHLDPATGAVKEWASPGGPRSQPYGITITPDGIVWYSESGIEPNTVVRFDPNTDRMFTWTIPSGGGVVRHMVHADAHTLWLACSGVNKIARVTIKGR